MLFSQPGHHFEEKKKFNRSTHTLYYVQNNSKHDRSKCKTIKFYKKNFDDFGLGKDFLDTLNISIHKRKSYKFV
jgi:hypothetical protein